MSGMKAPNVVTRVWKLLTHHVDPKYPEIDERQERADRHIEEAQQIKDMKDMNGYGRGR